MEDSDEFALDFDGPINTYTGPIEDEEMLLSDKFSDGGDEMEITPPPAEELVEAMPDNMVSMAQYLLGRS